MFRGKEGLKAVEANGCLTKDRPGEKSRTLRKTEKDERSALAKCFWTQRTLMFIISLVNNTSDSVVRC